MPRTWVDLADIRPCFHCRRDALHFVIDPTDSGIDGQTWQLEPFTAPGEDVRSGYRIEGGRWVTHLAAGSPPGAVAFPPHKCAGALNRKGTTRMSQPFADAAAPGASGPSMDELEGRLLLFKCSDVKAGLSTNYPDSLAALGDIVDLTTGDVHVDAALWGTVITRQFTAGQQYVGRIGKGTASGTHSAPWLWNNGDENDKNTAVKYLTHVAAESVATPAAAPFTPPADTVSASPPAAATAAPPWAS